MLDQTRVEYICAQLIACKDVKDRRIRKDILRGVQDELWNDKPHEDPGGLERWQQLRVAFEECLDVFQVLDLMSMFIVHYRLSDTHCTEMKIPLKLAEYSDMCLDDPRIKPYKLGRLFKLFFYVCRRGVYNDARRAIYHKIYLFALRVVESDTDRVSMRSLRSKILTYIRYTIVIADPGEHAGLLRVICPTVVDRYLAWNTYTAPHWRKTDWSNLHRILVDGFSREHNRIECSDLWKEIMSNGDIVHLSCSLLGQRTHMNTLLYPMRVSIYRAKKMMRIFTLVIGKVVPRCNSSLSMLPVDIIRRLGDYL